MKIIGKVKSKLIDEDNNLLLQLSISNYNSKKRIEELDKTKTYQFEIKEVKSKRSIQQNRLFWAILNDLSREMQDDEENIYCHLLEDTNTKYVWFKGLRESKEDLLKVYRAVKITRYDEDKLAVFKCYEGSSKFNVKEMNQLIDKAISWASEFGLKYDKENYYE